MILKPSLYQKNIFKEFRETDNNIVVIAVPGSGKSTTILELLNFVSPSKKAIYLAFNKSIVEEIKLKIPKYIKNINVNTLHSLGLSTIYKNSICKIKVDNYKSTKIFYELNENKWKSNEKRLGYSSFIVSCLWHIYRINLFTSIEQLRQNMQCKELEAIDEDFERLKDLIVKMNDYNNISHPKFEKMVDFVDMLYLPVKQKMQFNKFDEIFIDECQDLNILQQIIVGLIKSEKARFVAVGDANQSIYGFMGADKNSFNNFTSNSNTVSLPLSVTYRCKKNIVNYVNSIYNVVESFEGLEGDGEVRDGSILEVKGGDFILCRNNLPLVECFLFLLTQKKKAFIRGKDLGYALFSLIKPIKNNEEMEMHFNKELFKIESDLLKKGIQNPRKTGNYRNLLEKIDIIKLLLKKFESIIVLKETIESFFTDDIENKNSIILSTIHKSKGLEADNIFILQINLIPSQYAETSEALMQEENLKYVAFSRAKDKLIFLVDFPLKKVETNKELCQSQLN